MVYKILNSYKSIIFLNGDFPDKRLFDYIDLNTIVIAADGAAIKLKDFFIKPNYNIGDGDSIGKNRSHSFIKILDQNKTDFEKSIIFAKNLNLLPSLVLGFGGGEIDHIIGNMQIILKYCDNKELFFLDTYSKKKGFGIKLGVVLNQKFNIKLSKYSTITIIPFKEAIITTKGLKWELNEKKINSNFFSLRNYNVSKEVLFKLKKGKALIILDISQEIESIKQDKYPKKLLL